MLVFQANFSEIHIIHELLLASAGPRTWNGLPSDIRNEGDEETFKKKLKPICSDWLVAKKIHSAVQCQQLHKGISTTLLH